MRFSSRFPLAAAFLLGSLVMPFAQQTTPKLSQEQLQFFEKNIRPLLVDHCYSCHSSKSEKGAKGGLYLDTREGLLRGGTSGPAIVRGNPDKSLLIKAVRYHDEDLQMPPKDQKLADEQIALLEEWVAAGAPDPRNETSTPKASIDFSQAREHWSFRPVMKPALPQVKNPKWVQSPIDAFVLAKLDEKRLAPSPAADRRTLIRRATFDLIGLPPTPAEVDAFLQDKSSTPEAFAKVVDRLLDSPHYGERWGRHWLDVARYADTTGDRNNRGDTRYPYSFTYRDYVINAFNKDLPYSQFILEQIAADLLPQTTTNNESLAALGFLTVGKRFMNNANDIIDDRIDVVTQGFLGLTVSCARCHDHKFDPVPTRDYYALHGVFNSSVEPEEKPIIGKFVETEAYRDYLQQLKNVDEEVVRFRQRQLETLSRALRESISDYLLAEVDLDGPNDPAKINIARRYKLNINLLDLWRESRRKLERRGNEVFNPWFAFSSADTRKRFSEKAEAIRTAVSHGRVNGRNVNPIVAAAFAEANITTLQDVAKVYQKLFTEADKAVLAKAGSASLNETDEIELNEETSQEAWDEIREALLLDGKVLQLEDRQARRLLGNQVANREAQIRAEKVSLHIEHPGSPRRAMVLNDASRPRNSRILIRGERGNLGPEAPRQFLEILSGPQPQPFQNGSGRLELAQAIASKDNPLTARVLVNRIWQSHFGQPIVRTPNDFGLRSEPPTHPELLDYLASYFVENGWSIKKLHRLMMLSSTYRQSSVPKAEFAKTDPENKYLWRMNLQRLDFEEVRDGLLFVGATLDPELGGPPFSVSDLASNHRRTVYALVDRLTLPESFRIFDFANPDMTAGQRYRTTVPQQALFFMNSQLVSEQARKLAARREVQSAATEAGKIEAMFKITYQRPPTDKEMNLAADFLAAEKMESPSKTEEANEPARRKGRARLMRERPVPSAQRGSPPQLTPLERYAQVLLQSNEFIFIN